MNILINFEFLLIYTVSYVILPNAQIFLSHLPHYYAFVCVIFMGICLFGHMSICLFVQITWLENCIPKSKEVKNLKEEDFSVHILFSCTVLFDHGDSSRIHSSQTKVLRKDTEMSHEECDQRKVPWARPGGPHLATHTWGSPSLFWSLWQTSAANAAKHPSGGSSACTTYISAKWSQRPNTTELLGLLRKTKKNTASSKVYRSNQILWLDYLTFLPPSTFHFWYEQKEEGAVLFLQGLVSSNRIQPRFCTEWHFFQLTCQHGKSLRQQGCGTGVGRA